MSLILAITLTIVANVVGAVWALYLLDRHTARSDWGKV